MSNEHVCIGCGRFVTKHPSMLCRTCFVSHTQNANAQEGRDYEPCEGIDTDTGRNTTKWRTLPGPRDESEDE